MRSAAQLPEARDFNLQEKETPADGVITSYGILAILYVYSQDAAVLNRLIERDACKKIANIYDIDGDEDGAPVIGLTDCTIETSGSYGCFKLWKCLPQAGNGIGS